MVQLVHCIPKPCNLLPHLFKSRLVLPFWYQLIQVSLENRPLNECIIITIIVKKLNSLKHLVRTTLAESHN